MGMLVAGAVRVFVMRDAADQKADGILHIEPVFPL